MRRKVFIIIFMFIVTFLFCSGITYSMFNSSVKVMTNQNIAKFVFNATKTDEIQLPLVDLVPGGNKDYYFAVSNNYQGKTSDVVIKYRLTVKTMHLMPLDITLYKINDEDEDTVLVCDENYSRNLDNELVCNAKSEEELAYTSELQDQYRINVAFPSQYSGEEFANLVDYIDIEISSYQKTE